MHYYTFEWMNAFAGILIVGLGCLLHPNEEKLRVPALQTAIPTEMNERFMCLSFYFMSE